MQRVRPSLRSILLVAAFDFAESLRSKRAVAVLLLYILAAAGGMAIFVQVLNKIREAGQMELPPEETIKLIGGLIGSADVAELLVTIPLHSLFYGWIAMTLVPIMVVMTSSDAVAGEVSSGSVRFALFRCDRLSWVLGIFLGQILLMLVGILLGAVGAHTVAALFARGHPFAEGLAWMLRLALRSAVYGTAFLGLALGFSQITRSVGWARALSLFALIGFSLLYSVLELRTLRSELPVVSSVVKSLLPNSYSLDLWRPQLARRLVGMAALAGLSLLYFGLGFLAFRRRDA